MSQKRELTPEEKAAKIAEYQAHLDDKVAKARKALAALNPYTQEQVDKLVKACAKAVFDNGEELAKDAVAETKLGNVPDKIAKNKNKAKIIWWSLRDKKSVGIIEREKGTGIIKVGSPVGVVGAITPMTNPIVTCMSNAMFAIKGRNPIIFAVHPKAMECCKKTVNYMNAELKKLGAPDNVIQILDIAALELTQMLTKAVDVIIATGGMDMVRSVYSSGKPALGVGAGNVQTIVDRGMDYNDVAPKVIAGRSFDNGIICAAEQSVILPREDFDKAMKAFEANGSYIVANADRAKLRDVIFPGGHMSRDLVGKNAEEVAAAAGLKVPAGTKILIVEAENVKDVLGWEKMFPVLTAYRYDKWEEAVEIARDNLHKIGLGHSVSVHSTNDANIEYAGTHIEVSRVVINQSCASTAGGSFFNGLNPTNTLGCGSWGNNSISENLTYYHLINISRIAYFMKDNKVPTEAEIWA
ncbi:Succinate-semialdehyde dehydrogenase (acetylating) [uncultured delta proteobacterium]|uniref:Succinate-semialdehyde dehydrogenase (Acetylating) n=1 Tax=uncultured delta proteobacterium TaxID=34034 RepID=A0A212JII3_9DELT|nr:Succinate-semialdehyde dehydrogenase (acetylating) [uncultured delta proteobacterium]